LKHDENDDSLLDVQHQKGECEDKPASSLVVSKDKALNRKPLPLNSYTGSNRTGDSL